jgi:hypothetical protein
MKSVTFCWLESKGESSFYSSIPKQQIQEWQTVSCRIHSNPKTNAKLMVHHNVVSFSSANKRRHMTETAYPQRRNHSISVGTVQDDFPLHPENHFCRFPESTKSLFQPKKTQF